MTNIQVVLELLVEVTATVLLVDRVITPANPSNRSANMNVNVKFSFLLIVACLVVAGCKSGKAPVVLSPASFIGPSPSEVAPIEYSAQDDLLTNDWEEFRSQPLTSETELPTDFLEISLDEAIGIALQDTEVLRSLAATAVLRNAEQAPSAFDSAIQSTDPTRGIEAALAQFDTNLNSSVLYSKNDDFFNNTTSTGNASEVKQDLTALNFGLSKRAATGTLFQIASDVVHDSSTNPALGLPTSWTTNWEATVRHPLLQGSGTLFNRIAGPTTRSQFQGVSGYLISRTNNDISIAQFERSVREMVLEIIDSYWQLSLAFENFETVRSARDAALETWNIAKARFNQGLEGGEADRESQAREQYYLFEAQLARSLNGQQDNGSPGVLQAEANLRRLLNLPQSDDRLMMPIDEPVKVKSIINWDALVADALESRVELKEQRVRIKQTELLLLASRNFTLPRLDGIATYRNNGLGDDLIGGSGKFAGAYNEAFSGNYDEWEFGFAFDMPIGFRQAHAGVRNSELRLSRERAVFKEAQRQLLHELGTSVRQVNQAFQNIEWTELRRDAAKETVASRQAAFKADAVGFEDLLDSQQRLLEAELDFQRAKTDYELARETLFSNSGQLLCEHAVILAEGPSGDDGF